MLKGPLDLKRSFTTDSKLNIGIVVPSNNQAGAQKLAAIAAVDLSKHGCRIHIFVPRLPYYYYFVTLRRNPIAWLKVVRHYLVAFIRNRKFCFEDLILSEDVNSRVSIHNILRRPSRRQLSGLDRVIVMTIAQVAELENIYPQEKTVYQIHHPEESIYEFPELFKRIRVRFNGKIIAISPSTAKEVVDHIPEPPVVPDVVSGVFWRNRFISQYKKRHSDILFHYSLETHKGSEIGENLIRTIRQLRPQTTVTVWSRDEEPRLHDVTVMRHIPESILCELYLSHKLLLFPSTFEGFGMPPIEAMACSCIPILYPGVGANDLYARDGENSIFINNDLEITAARISELLDNRNRLESMRNKMSKRLDPFNPEGYGIRLLSTAGINFHNQ